MQANILAAARATGYRTGPWRQRLRFLAQKIPQQAAWDYALAWTRHITDNTGRKPALLYLENCLFHWKDDEEAGLEHQLPPGDGQEDRRRESLAGKYSHLVQR